MLSRQRVKGLKWVLLKVQVANLLLIKASINVTELYHRVLLHMWMSYITSTTYVLLIC